MSTAALRAVRINSNKCIERCVLPPVRSSNAQPQDSAITFSNVSVSTRTPYLGLLFVAPGMFWGREENHKLEQQVAEAYGRYFGGKLIAVGCNECLTESFDGLRSCAGPWGPATGTPGLVFWPSDDGLRVRVSHDDVALHRYTSGEQMYLLPNHIEDLVGQLGFSDQDDSTLLVFANAFPAYITATACLFNAIQKRCKGTKTSLWGGYFNDDTSIAEKVAADNCVLKDASFVLIRLTGPRLSSATTIIRCNKSRQEVDAQLRRFKDRLNLRRRCILLMSGPVKIDAGECGYPNCREFKAAAKRIFRSDVQILGAFSNMPHAIGVESSAHDCNKEQRYLWHNCMSVMILTYD